MKYLLSTLIALITFAFLATAPPVLAQTPDGEMPANEMVCSPLQADGITKGLYGLCVAFCEAQDHASIDEPITEAEFEALGDAAPSGRILGNYYKKKQASDPDMPCIKVEEPCPCWDGEQFDEVTLAVNEVYSCRRWNGSSHNGSQISNWTSADVANTYGRVYVLDHEHGTGDVGRQAVCRYQARRGGVITQQSLRITREEHAACDSQIRTRMVELALICSDGS
jgi:hypothetical protein